MILKKNPEFTLQVGIASIQVLAFDQMRLERNTFKDFILFSFKLILI